jgi:WD40 repeat protein
VHITDLSCFYIQLWRSLFIRHFPSVSLRRQTSSLNTSKYWKLLFKISARWQSLRATTSTLSLNSNPQSSASKQRQRPNTLIQHHGPYIFTIPRIRKAEGVKVYSSSPGGAIQEVGEVHLDGKDNVEARAMQLDAAVEVQGTGQLADVELSIFFADGGFEIYRIHLEKSSVSEDTQKPLFSHSLEFSHRPLYSRAGIEQAIFHTPLIVVLLGDGKIAFWIVTPPKEDSSCGLKLTPLPMHSLEATHIGEPCVISLSNVVEISSTPPPEITSPRVTSIPPTSETSFNLSLAYPIPAYPPMIESPHSSSLATVVAVQSFHLTVNPSATKDREKLVIHRDATQFACSLPAPTIFPAPSPRKGRTYKRKQSEGDDGDDGVLQSDVNPTPGVMSITMSPPYILTSHSSNVVRSYLIETPPTSEGKPINSISVLPTLTSSKHLTTPLTAMSSSSLLNRCVSGGKDGRIRIWDLKGDGDGDLARLVEETTEVEEEVEGEWTLMEVRFDEDRIVGVLVEKGGEERLKVYSFE